MRWRFLHFLLLGARRRLAALFTNVIFSLSSAAVCIFEIDECDRLLLGRARVCVCVRTSTTTSGGGDDDDDDDAVGSICIWNSMMRRMKNELRLAGWTLGNAFSASRAPPPPFITSPSALFAQDGRSSFAPFYTPLWHRRREREMQIMESDWWCTRVLPCALESSQLFRNSTFRGDVVENICIAHFDTSHCLPHFQLAGTDPKLMLCGFAQACDAFSH
jgi:hypothetical protein